MHKYIRGLRDVRCWGVQVYTDHEDKPIEPKDMPEGARMLKGTMCLTFYVECAAHYLEKQNALYEIEHRPFVSCLSLSSAKQD